MKKLQKGDDRKIETVCIWNAESPPTKTAIAENGEKPTKGPDELLRLDMIPTNSQRCFIIDRQHGSGVLATTAKVGENSLPQDVMGIDRQ